MAVEHIGFDAGYPAEARSQAGVATGHERRMSRLGLECMWDPSSGRKVSCGTGRAKRFCAGAQTLLTEAPAIRDVRPPDDFDPAMPDFIPTAFVSGARIPAWWPA
jgi:hypothetical protein